MIITILPNSANFHAVAYNECKVNEGMAELLEVKNFNTLNPEHYNAENFREYLDNYSRRNAYITNAQFHFSVSCKGKEYTHQQLLDIAHRFLKEMGYADEGQPLLVYAHHDTPNNHIHVVTSRIAPDGHKIDHSHEKRRARQITEKIMNEQENPLQIVQDAMSYSYTSKVQFCAILSSLGYETRDDDEKPILHIYKIDEKQGQVNVMEIMRHAVKANKPEQKRRRQLRAILQKYRNMSANKEELAAAMKKKFGISLVFLGRKDNPFCYVLVDHKNKTVFKGGEFLAIKELLQFDDAPTRFAKIELTIDELLKDNPKLTTYDINKILYRQFGTCIHHGEISWNGETIKLRTEVVEQLRQNNFESKGMKEKPVSIRQPNEGQPTRRFTRKKENNSLDAGGGSNDANREFEVGGSMDLGVDDEAHQRMKWRR